MTTRCPNESVGLVVSDYVIFDNATDCVPVGEPVAECVSWREIAATFLLDNRRAAKGDHIITAEEIK